MARRDHSSWSYLSEHFHDKPSFPGVELYVARRFVVVTLAGHLDGLFVNLGGTGGDGSNIGEDGGDEFQGVPIDESVFHPTGNHEPYLNIFLHVLPFAWLSTVLLAETNRVMLEGSGVNRV